MLHSSDILASMWYIEVFFLILKGLYPLMCLGTSPGNKAFMQSAIILSTICTHPE